MKTRHWLILGLVGVMFFVLSGSAMAAGFIGEENVYILPADQVIEDDLYISANEIIIDGTVNGDLFAAASYIEINGTVTGDLFAAAAGIELNGTVGDDARIGGAGVEVNGVIGDDLFVGAGGTTPGFSAPITLDNRSIAQGLFIKPTTQVGGDLFVGAGTGQIAGNIAGDVYAGMGSMTFSAVVGGDAELASEDINLTNDAAIAGSLRYSSQTEQAIPSGAARGVEFNPVVVPVESQPTAVQTATSWVLRTALILLGFVILGWLVMRFSPQSITKPGDMLQKETGKSAVYGMLAAIGLIFIPLVSILLIVMVALFWGAWPAVVLFLALFSVLSLMWLFSPLVTGYWLGRVALPTQTPLVALLIGLAVIVLLSRIPVIGWIISLISFVLALGALLVNRMGVSGPKPVEQVMPEKMMPAAGG